MVNDLDSYRLSADGQKVMYKSERDWFIVDARPLRRQAPATKKPLDLSHMRIRIDPTEEWREMFQSAWRLERDLFYQPAR